MATITVGQKQQEPIPDLWSGDSRRFWARSSQDRPVDVERTAALVRYDIPIMFPAGTSYQGDLYGQPVQQVPVTAPRFRCLDLRQPWWPFWTWAQRASIPMPDPGRIYVEGGPFDQHWRCVEGNTALWEVWKLQSGGWPIADLQCSSFARWRLDLPWNAPGQPMGVVAAGFPHTPLLLRWEDLPGLRHACFLGLDNYAPGVTGPARSYDGDSPGHPCRAGEWLRLRREVVSRLSLAYPGMAGVLQGLGDVGAYVGDRTWWPGRGDRIGIIQGVQDERLSMLGQLQLRLSDFEVVAS